MTLDPEKPLILRWTWRHYRLECVEVIEPDGTTRRLNDDDLEVYRDAPEPSPEPPQPPVVAEVRILSPRQEGHGGRRQTVVWDLYPSLAAAEEAAAELRPRLGDRVTAKVIGT